MIRSLFIPEKIGSYYLLKKRVVGIEITDRSIFATVMTLSGRKRTIQAIYEEQLTGSDDQIVRALQSLALKIGKNNSIILSLPSSQIIFKELTLPFIGQKKIKMIVPLEVEHLLPFSIDEGVIDSIVTKEHHDEQKTDILVAAVKQDVLDRYSGYFAEAELSLDKVSVDIFDLYGLYKQFYTNDKPVALLDSGVTHSTLGLIVDGKLSYIRSFQQGIDSNSNAKRKEQLESLCQKVRMTLDVTLSKIMPGTTIAKVILSGMVTDIKGTKELVSNALNVPVERLYPQKLVSSGQVSSKVATLPGSFMVSIATAFASEKTYDFTLLQAQAQYKAEQVTTYQLIVAAAMIATLFLSFAAYSFLRVRTLKNAYKSAEKEAIRELQRQFKLRPSHIRNLGAANKAAQADLKKQKTAWGRISPDRRYAYLKYLAELTKCIKMKESELQLTSLIIKDDTVKLYGSVPGYPQLNKLQTQLECPLFKRVPKLQDKNFKTEPITLTVNQEEL